MRINEHTVVASSSALLLPYLPLHVPTYHEWMQDPDIQVATASEPLTLEEEYAMQKSWQEDGDKLTFIVYEPNATEGMNGNVEAKDFGQLGTRGMIGDVNLFLSLEEDEEGKNIVVGEVEIMIAEKGHQGRGLGRGALVTFLRFVVEHEKEIVQEFLGNQKATGDADPGLGYLRVKIGEHNSRSLTLFEGVGFERVGEVNYFGELELRRYAMDLTGVEASMKKCGIERYQAMKLQVDDRIGAQ